MATTIFKIYKNKNLVSEMDLESLKEISPKWAGEIELGDIIKDEFGKELRVMELVEHFPDTEDEDFIIELHVKDM